MYEEGTKIICNEVHGIVVENTKLPGDICIKWNTGQFCSYDKEWLDDNAEILGDKA